MRWQKCKVMWGTANHFTTSDNSVQVQSNLKNAHNFAKLELTLLETGNLKYDNFICWLHKTFLRTSSLRQLNNSFRNSYFSLKIRQKFESATLKNSCLERNLTPRSTSWKCYIICWVNERYTSIVMILITKCLLIAKANNLFISVNWRTWEIFPCFGGTLKLLTYLQILKDLQICKKLFIAKF